MNALLPILVLAAVQGITEFLPISSSAHLILTWKAFDMGGVPVLQHTEADRLVLDIAVHVGTLGAVVFFFWRDVGRIIAGAGKLLIGRWTPGGRLFLLLVLATIPLVAAGLALKIYVGTNFRSAEVIAWASIGFGILLYAVDKTSMTVKQMDHMTLVGALFVGLSQILALVPGTSRSGITMTAARFLGFERTDAARFSMLLSIPAILGAGTLAGKDLYDTGNVALGLDALIAAALALVCALIAIWAMMAWLRRASFTPFVVYRVLLGFALLYLVYFEGLK